MLVLNVGSSSVKFRAWVLGPAGWQLDCRGQLAGIGTAPVFRVWRAGCDQPADDTPYGPIDDAATAVAHVADWLEARLGAGRVSAVGHRVVHGGPRHADPVVVTSEVLAGLRELVPLAPLHQPACLDGIEAMARRWPGVPQVACFDTAFHRGQPEVASVLALPAHVRQAGVQRYGFHGLSYEYIAAQLPRVAPDVAAGRVIVAHLGSGASLCAIHGGRSVDQTFGMTPLDGLCMGTRPGSLDPGVVLFLLRELRLGADEVERLLYGRSGLLGLSGISADVRDLLASDAPAARLAIDYFVYRAAREIGALAAVLGGVDALVFTAGIGEHSPEIRARISAACAWLGVSLDPDANLEGRTVISARSSRLRVFVIPTDEEHTIAQHAARLAGLPPLTGVAGHRWAGSTAPARPGAGS
ncbi:MAG: acetate/propionate family kinase [Chromatiales bacterium]|jgi:acetate kinase|nr:acetate/propionate family kinase [Chromatiales bacterium]